MSSRMAAVLLVSALVLAGCGTTPGERAISGGAIGAAGGAAAGALVGAPGAGALIGGGIGAAAGASTTPNQIYLGRPAWQ